MSEEKVVFQSGASSSKIPRFDMIPRSALVRLAKRFELGNEKHGPRSWNALQNNQALQDKDWIIARAAHVIDHALKFMAKYTGQMPDDGDDDASAIMWGGTCLCAATEQSVEVAQPKARKEDEILMHYTYVLGFDDGTYYTGASTAMPFSKDGREAVVFQSAESAVYVLDELKAKYIHLTGMVASIIPHYSK